MIDCIENLELPCDSLEPSYKNILINVEDLSSISQSKEFLSEIKFVSDQAIMTNAYIRINGLNFGKTEHKIDALLGAISFLKNKGVISTVLVNGECDLSLLTVLKKSDSMIVQSFSSDKVKAKFENHANKIGVNVSMLNVDAFIEDLSYSANLEIISRNGKELSLTKANYKMVLAA